MVIVGLISWWYTNGWLTLARKVRARVGGVLGFFSVGLLAGSLFAPFRQIAAGRVDGSITAQLQAWGDRLFSRGVGFVIRSLLIVAGLITVAVVAIVGYTLCIVWPFLPLAPVIGLMALGMGI
ncbi:MAG TPA: hypothetical protein VM581_00920 [Magnetospirillaceae bacterium]|nr:hypothetical protein [Magnetospirillaceae bacterium]